MTAFEEPEFANSEMDSVEQIAEEMRQEEKLAQRQARPRPRIPDCYMDTTRFIALTAEEYQSACDRSSFKEEREILVIEPIDAFVYIDHLLPAHIVGIDDSGTSLELYRHSQDNLVGLHTLGKITAHGSTFKNCEISAHGDNAGMGIYLSDCRSERCQLRSPGECKVGGGKFKFLEVESQSRIEILSSTVETLKLSAPECHVALRQGPSAASSCITLQAQHASLHGSLGSITGEVDSLTLPLGSLNGWHGQCRQRTVTMTPNEFAEHLRNPQPAVLPSDRIRVSGTTRQVLILEDHHEIQPNVEILASVDISRRHQPWSHPIVGIIIVSRDRKQEINGSCQSIRLAGSAVDLTPAEYRQWCPLPANHPTQDLELELF